MKTYYCWRCQGKIPMLEENEWERIYPVLMVNLENIVRIRKERECDLVTAKCLAFNEACDIYFEMTGFRETDPNAIWHHRLANYGPECPQCGHLFRTLKAAFCANCGYQAKSVGGTGVFAHPAGR